MTRHTRLAAALVSAGLIGGGVGGGLAASSGTNTAKTARGTTTTQGRTPVPSYAWYSSMMGGLGYPAMMGSGNYSWMFGRSGYNWMMGGANAPGWERGSSLPGFMMGGAVNPGEAMGQLFANEPGPRVSASAAKRLGNTLPNGAVANSGAKRLSFSSTNVALTVLASPSMPDESFRIAGMTNPTVVVPVGARVRVELINADSDMAHGFVVSEKESAFSFMPMMTAAPAFAGASRWFLGESTSAGMHVATISFTASTPGAYAYLCPVPGHAEKGMVGTFIVKA